LADKLLQCTVLVCLAIKNIAPYWLGILYISKELFMICGALITFKKIKVVVKSNWYGKATTAIFYAMTFIIFLFRENLGDTGVLILFALAVISALFSMIMYIIDTLRVNSEIKKSGVHMAEND
jgi:cardiolipin synthase